VSKLALIVTIDVIPGQMEAVLEATKAHAARTLISEPGTLRFDVLVPADDDTKIVIHEAYEDEAAFEVHGKGESLAIVRKAIEGKVGNTSAVRCTWTE
jgi:quinol monooxygenase YgiN